MRHRKHRGALGRPSGHRRALLANLAAEVIMRGRIQTTEPKARALRPYVEKMVTLAKRGDLHARRQALAALRQRRVVDHLFHEVGPMCKHRQGGYMRITKTGFRVGDAAPMAVIEFVDSPEDASN